MTYAVWPAVHAERAALVADLSDLSPEQWATPSLLAVTGRRVALAELSGPGADLLAERL